jgi:DNA-binding XRE family transcriptional regulator
VNSITEPGGESPVPTRKRAQDGYIDYRLCTRSAGTEKIGDVVTKVTDPRIPLGQEIKRRRLKTGMTQEELAEAADLHWTYISGIERGVRNVSIVNLFNIANALKVRVRDLVRVL